MIAILRRSLQERPLRTALFLLGYALGVAVVTVLLSVGAAVLAEARDKDLLGGGDVILLPAGIDVESLQVGGSSALYYRIPGLRFLLRAVLESPRVRPHLAAVSPRFAGSPLYLEAHGRVTSAVAVATVPSREREVLPRWAWPDSFRDDEAERRLLRPTPGEALCDMDHFHAPPPRARALRWAEWHYFEIFDPATRRFAYLSFQLFGDWAGAPGAGAGVVAVQLGDAGGGVRRRAAPELSGDITASLARPDLRIAGSQVRLEGGAYRVRFRVPGASGEVAFEPVPGLCVPPAESRGDSGRVSGYVVPFLRASARGVIREAGRTWAFDRAVGYHDHNWGAWKDVTWNWGKVSTDSLSLLYGEVTAPGSRGRAFAAVFSDSGLVGLFQPDSIERTWGPRTAAMPAGAARIPDRVALRAATAGGDSLDARIEVRGTAATAIPGDPEFSVESLRSARIAFLQMRGEYRLRAVLAGRARSARGPGPLETYSPISPGKR